MAGKRRGAGEGTLRRRADGRREGRIQLPGRAKVKVVDGRPKAEASAALQRVRVDAARGHMAAGWVPQLRTYATDWLTSTARPRVRPRTYDSYGYAMETHVVPWLGRHRLDALSPAIVQA